jgi:hypothetical protein
VPASREYEDNPYNDGQHVNPRSAEANLQKSKANNLHSIERPLPHDTRTPHLNLVNKEKVQDLIAHQNNIQKEILLPRIHSTRATESGLGVRPSKANSPLRDIGNSIVIGAGAGLPKIS